MRGEEMRLTYLRQLVCGLLLRVVRHLFLALQPLLLLFWSPCSVQGGIMLEIPTKGKWSSDVLPFSIPLHAEPFLLCRALALTHAVTVAPLTIGIHRIGGLSLCHLALLFRGVGIAIQL